MADIAKTHRIDPDLEAALLDAAASGKSVRVKGEGAHTLRVRVEVGDTPDIWDAYDPEKVRAAVRRSAELGASVDPADLDPLIADIRSQRDQAPRSTP